MQIWGLFLKEYKEPSNIDKEQAASQKAVKAKPLLFLFLQQSV